MFCTFDNVAYCCINAIFPNSLLEQQTSHSETGSDICQCGRQSQRVLHADWCSFHVFMNRWYSVLWLFTHILRRDLMFPVRLILRSAVMRPDGAALFVGNCNASFRLLKVLTPVLLISFAPVALRLFLAGFLLLTTNCMSACCNETTASWASTCKSRSRAYVRDAASSSKQPVVISYT
jgi:hypothetical protein